MARILKGHAARKRSIAAFDRRDLEEAPEPGAGLEPEAALPMDPVALREHVLEGARQEAEAKIRDAYEAGFAKGREAGEAAFQAEVAQAAAMLQAAAGAIEAAREAFLEQVEPEVLELVRRIAERVLDREIQTDGKLILSVTRRALAQILDREFIRLRVHPADYEALRAHRVTLLEEFEGVKRLEIEVDDAVSPGGCLADSGLMHIDARPETMLENILNALRA